MNIKLMNTNRSPYGISNHEFLCTRFPLVRRYECSAVNDYGRATGHALLRVRQPGATDALVIRAFQDATEEIDRAINKTLSSLFNSDRSGTARVDPFRAGRFPNAIGRAAARPAEIFERTLVNVRRLINAGAAANVTGEFRYEEILSPEQVGQKLTTETAVETTI